MRHHIQCLLMRSMQNLMVVAESNETFLCCHGLPHRIHSQMHNDKYGLASHLNAARKCAPVMQPLLAYPE